MRPNGTPLTMCVCVVWLHRWRWKRRHSVRACNLLWRCDRCVHVRRILASAKELAHSIESELAHNTHWPIGARSAECEMLLNHTPGTHWWCTQRVEYTATKLAGDKEIEADMPSNWRSKKNGMNCVVPFCIHAVASDWMDVSLLFDASDEIY